MPHPTERRGICVKKAPNYPPHPPVPASRHPEQALNTSVDCQSPEHLGTAVNWVWFVSQIPHDCNQSGECSNCSG